MRSASSAASNGSWRHEIGQFEFLISLISGTAKPALRSPQGGAGTNHVLFPEHIARSQRRVEVTGPYGTIREWSVLPTKPDNHCFDCLVGCAVAASVLGVRVPGQDAKPVRQRKRYTQADLRRPWPWKVHRPNARAGRLARTNAAWNAAIAAAGTSA